VGSAAPACLAVVLTKVEALAKAGLWLINLCVVSSTVLPIADNNLLYLAMHDKYLQCEFTLEHMQVIRETFQCLKKMMT
jgi:hypothetical protein